MELTWTTALKLSYLITGGRLVGEFFYTHVVFCNQGGEIRGTQTPQMQTSYVCTEIQQAFTECPSPAGHSLWEQAVTQT